MESQAIINFLTSVGSIIAADRAMLMVAAMTIGFFGFSRWVLKRDIVHAKTVASIVATLMIYVANILFVPIIYYANEPVRQAYQRIGIPAIPTEFWAHVPRIALTVIALLLYDLLMYWYHRFLHTTYAWPIHAIHHSDPDVNGFTTYRVHMLEGLLKVTFMILFFSWLGLPGDVLAATALFAVLLNAYVHFDVDWGHGPLRKIIASPRFHRWHHADTPQFYGKNLANMFPFYDVMFGTYIDPGVCREPMGARGVPENDVVRLIAYPFTQWARMLRQAVARRQSGTPHAAQSRASSQ